MRIESQDGRSFIELNRRDEGGYLVLATVAEIDEFTAHNHGSIIADAPAFLGALAAFEASRQGEIAFHGDEGEFELRIRAFDRQGHLWVGASLARRLHGGHAGDVEPTLFSGGFVFDAEYATGLFADLRRLLRAAA